MWLKFLTCNGYMRITALHKQPNAKKTIKRNYNTRKTKKYAFVPLWRKR